MVSIQNTALMLVPGSKRHVLCSLLNIDTHAFFQNLPASTSTAPLCATTQFAQQHALKSMPPQKDWRGNEDRNGQTLHIDWHYTSRTMT